ncbi:hypothetical protein DL89DRAFT_289563 [Linderina pennispora]|uniref:Uncharacterized protein n=1 Tax=Linderina pennispora TaxID=61395 RepID=A0A1Y1WK51_9FUNG|nr:uncharacterized protein DL89DRAFT_289563 [Linderina pennispora]ORX73863.1 hypothetical protein DL89DRAFT_289563 [Linderina pennispora]
MVDLLVQEDIRQADADDSTTGACMEYLLDNDVLDDLVKLAEADVPVGVRGVVISNLSTFINLTDDKLLVQKAVHNPILALLRAYLQTENNGISQSTASLFDAKMHAYDDEFVDLMYALCSKIRGEPMLLNIFFQDRRWLRSLEQRCLSSDSIPAMNRSFILFSHLLRFVHIEGKAGDTARTSLLSWPRMAAPRRFERFILDDSGFAPLLAASLGALYSQLPRSLTLYTADLQNAIESSIFAAGGAGERGEDRGAISSTSPQFRSRLAWFAQLLGFVQEVLFRCPSLAICGEVLRHLREHFLRAILYPSLLESSDTDGSSIAVMVYLELMLATARHEDLVAAIMEFLTEEPSAGGQESCLPFTLRDLIYTNLQSTVSTDAVIAALNLLRLVLSRHCRYAARLVELEKVAASGSTNVWMMNCTVAIDVHRQELEMAMVRSPARPDHDGLYIPWRREAAQQPSNRRALVPESFVIGYDEYLEDAAHEWEAHEAYHFEIDALTEVQRTRDRLAHSGTLSPMAKSGIGIGIGIGVARPVMRPPATPATAAPETCSSKPKPRIRWRVKQSDPVVRVLMGLLARYFAQPRECNLALTGVLAALIWLDNLRNLSDSADSDTTATICIGAPAILAADASQFLGLDKELQDAVRALPHGATPPALYQQVLRNEVPGFDSRLRRARNALMGIVEDADALDLELEAANPPRRDRGLSSASLEHVRNVLPPPPVRRDSLPRRQDNDSTHNTRQAMLANPLAGNWQALSVPPKDANIAEFLENVIILQESIKEIIARVQVRRENGGDEDAIV